MTGNKAEELLSLPPKSPDNPAIAFNAEKLSDLRTAESRRWMCSELGVMIHRQCRQRSGKTHRPD